MNYFTAPLMSRCKHFRIATNLGGTSHFFHDYPQSIAVHGVKRFGEINKGYVEVTVLFSGLLHKLSDSEDHIRRARVTAKAAL